MADNFGARMRGYVHPPATGAYIFWIASDDCSELWLSSDDAPLRKRLVCSNTQAGGVRDWTRTPTSKSAPVPLVAGKRYYIEALHKEGGSEDHLAVGWTLPDGTEERPIPGSRLSPWLTMPTPAGPPGATFYRAINFSGPATVIDGRRWEGRTRRTTARPPRASRTRPSRSIRPPTRRARR